MVLLNFMIAIAKLINLPVFHSITNKISPNVGA